MCHYHSLAAFFKPRCDSHLAKYYREVVVHVASDTFGYESAKAKLKEKNSSFDREICASCKKPEKPMQSEFVEAFSHSSSHLLTCPPVSECVVLDRRGWVREVVCV